ncbi:MAG: hypothetical protein Q7T96_04350 [Methylobacter sp.]|nr:hypothetical protein [Methylobacter sp.]
MAATYINVGRNKPVRALSAGLVFPALRLPETSALADTSGGLMLSFPRAAWECSQGALRRES